mmetsp:Transcript_7549/g.21651  ORF Transcript_7549/g.21651 Transcript_7549/m.21651 type:complete len:213 (+) Transcript_7549:118-756(+)
MNPKTIPYRTAPMTHWRAWTRARRSRTMACSPPRRRRARRPWTRLRRPGGSIPGIALKASRRRRRPAYRCSGWRRPSKARRWTRTCLGKWPGVLAPQTSHWTTTRRSMRRSLTGCCPSRTAPAGHSPECRRASTFTRRPCTVATSCFSRVWPRSSRRGAFITFSVRLRKWRSVRDGMTCASWRPQSSSSSHSTSTFTRKYRRRSMSSPLASS